MREQNKTNQDRYQEVAISVAADCAVLLVLQVLPYRQDILAGSAEVPSKDIPVRMREQVRELVDLSLEVGTRAWRRRGVTGE